MFNKIIASFFADSGDLGNTELSRFQRLRRIPSGTKVRPRPLPQERLLPAPVSGGAQAILPQARPKGRRLHRYAFYISH
jgi:hypothetical protein